MFLNQLREEEQKLYLGMASLLAAVDNELKPGEPGREDGIAGIFNRIAASHGQAPVIGKASISNEKESEHIKQVALQAGALSKSTIESIIEHAFDQYAEALNQILDLSGELTDEMRLKIAIKQLNNQLKEASELLTGALPETKKALLFELYSLALVDNVISPLEEQLLTSMTTSLGQDSFLAKELRTAAEKIKRAQAEAHTIITE
jgi:hypothetical protein